MKSPDVTIVICTYNRAHMLRDALESLMLQETANRFEYDILVVDNGSIDDTQQVVAQVAARSPVLIRSVVENKSGVACARNRGIAESDAPWIAFCDDDQIADTSWLMNLMAMAEETGSKFVGGAVRLNLPVAEETVSEAVRQIMSESIGKDSKQRYSRFFTAGAGNLLVNREVFDRVGVFDESLKEAGEDLDLFRRIQAARIDAWYTPDAIVRHVIPAYRLQENYLRWAAHRAGWCFAQRDRREWGLAVLLVLFVARLIKSLLVLLPKHALAYLSPDKHALLGMRCNRWRNEAYFRGVFYQISPRLFAQRRYYAQLEFRDERSQFEEELETVEDFTELELTLN